MAHLIKLELKKFGIAHEVFHNNVAGVLRSGETSLNHCKTALHKEYQCRTDQEPYAVNVIVYQT